MDDAPFPEAWIDDLLAEARRDLVFIFNITNGGFGGPKPMPPRHAIPALLERVCEGLLRGGCQVGFGDPDLDGWRVPDEICDAGMPTAERIVRMWSDDPGHYEFLTFSLRGPSRHIHKPIQLSGLSLVLHSASGDGMHLEAHAPAQVGNEPGPLFTFREDEQRGLQFVLHLPAKDITMPLSELKRAIALAEAEVHKESFYEPPGSAG